MKKIIVFFSLFLLVLTACKNKSKPQKKMRGEPICRYLGIDFSGHQGEVNWVTIDTQTKHPNITFFIFRAVRDNGEIDPYFTRNFKESKKRGFRSGGYLMFNPNTDPVIQTNSYISLVNLKKGDFRPIFDVEFLSDTLKKVREVLNLLKKDSAQLNALVMIRKDTVEVLKVLRDTLQMQFIASVKNCLSILEAHYGVKPIIYSGLNFFKENLMESFGFDYPLWIAAYDCDRRSDPVVTKSFILQFTDKINLPGVKGTVDGNDIDCKKLEDLLLK